MQAAASRGATDTLRFLDPYRIGVLAHHSSSEEAMKNPGLFAVALAAAILCATPISLRWSSNEMPSVSVDRANAQNRVAGANRRIDRTAYGPNYAGNPYVNYRYANPHVNYGNRYVNPYVNRR
jgi:hypothetical protein